ncbi:MAG TPA: hypothetical protein DCS93_36015 [Microscillaceae bacterium]|nr:hypothetical protein [Microscillaceae bacterium]
MKKNISINISGIIFYIEEDTYEELKNYLNSVEEYFSSYEDSKEIIADIENRMAEIFMSTLKDSKQVITPEDVQNLITTMGSVADFQAMEEDPAYQPVTSNPVFAGSTLELQTEAEYHESLKAQQSASKAQKTGIKEKEELVMPANQRHTIDYAPQYTGKNPLKTTRSRRLYRDGKHRVLGGVASGLAHYFNLDAMWVRLIFIALTFGLFMVPAIPIATIVSYIVLWLVVPYNNKLEENPRIKRFYRDGKHATVGGVVSGLSHYLGIELSLLRILFVIGIFLGGFSLVLYLVLWVISPEAKTITDHMKMEGEPITLKNIDSTVRKTINNIPKNKSAYTTTKAGQIVMFPFKMAGVLINSLSPLIRPFFVLASESIRIGGGAIAFITGLALTLGFTVAVVVTLGNFPINEAYVGPIPLRYYYSSIEMPELLATSIYFSFLIPSIFAIGIGVSLLLRRWVMRSRFSWTMLGLWVVSLIGVAVTLPRNINNFQYSNSVGQVQDYTFQGNTPVVLDVNWDNGEEDLRHPTLTLVGHAESNFKLEKDYLARGNSYKDAARNTKIIGYNIEQKGDILLFDRDITLGPNAKYRGQRVRMKLFVPFEKSFVLTRNIQRIIHARGGYRNMNGENLWKFTASGELVCTTCKPKEEEPEHSGIIESQTSSEKGERVFNINDFQALNVGGIFKVEVVRSNQTSLVAKGREADLDKIQVKQSGNELKISLNNRRRFNLGSKSIILEIRTPSLSQLNISGACKLEASGFQENEMMLDASGATKIELRNGNANKFILNVSGASKINAYDFKVKEARMDLSGASKVYTHVQNRLVVDASGASKVRYHGNPKVSTDNSGVSSVRKTD